MRSIQATAITQAVLDLVKTANYDLPDDVVSFLKHARQTEPSPTGQAILDQIIENAEISKNERVPLCQDTGVSVFFVELGQDCHIEGETLRNAIYEGVRQGYKEGYLRMSMCHPFTRQNTTDNTPAVIHLETVPGDKLRIVFAAKGGGSENMSKVVMMKPADGKEGIIHEVLEWVRNAGGNPCPPIILGLGIGGNFERCAYLAKRSILRELGKSNPDPELAQMEAELLEKINKLGVGPMGMGGMNTALAVNIEMEPCHIASLPVAINIQCHSARHKEVIL